MMTTDRTYPYTAWTLQPSFKPVQVEITQEADYWSRNDYDCNQAGKRYPLNELFPTKDGAITDGRRRLDEQQALLDKKAENIAKRRAALDKAEASK